MSFCILGMGTSVPRELITQEDAARLAVELAGVSSSHKPAIQALYRRAGVKKRHSAIITSSTNGLPATQSFFPVSTSLQDRGPTTDQRMRRYEECALQLAEQACCDALHASYSSPEEITHLVSVSCTGFSAPGVDLGLIKSLGLKSSVTRTNVGFMGCHGALNGLRVAAALSQASQGGKVLLCCVELCSIHHQYAANAQQIVANALFSDGAAAVVGSNDTSRGLAWRVLDQFSAVLPETSELMTWRIGDNGFEMQLSPVVPSVIRESLRPWLLENLARHSLQISDVNSWAIHPGGPKILRACADSLGLALRCLDPSQKILEEYGNMSSPTVLFILHELRDSRLNLPCVALAFGPGLTIEAALIA
jgi:predicted naringenin-chalcone synthase